MIRQDQKLTHKESSAASDENKRFVSYLWGIETMNTIQKISLTQSSLYRTYEELKLDSNRSLSFMPLRLYRTYEELKLRMGSLLSPSGASVCIVPMRNWNSIIESVDIGAVQSFVSYLWGIETSNWWRDRGASLVFVSYLWGIETKELCNILGEQVKNVCIVPMRNWNIILCLSSHTLF